MKILGTGCGKSGTLWVAKLLTALGHPCVHERQFTPTRSGPLRVSEVSWLAVPFARDYTGDAQLLRIVRNPYHVVQSIIRTGFLDIENGYMSYVRDHDAWVARGPTHLNRAIRYVAGWDLHLDDLPYLVLHPDLELDHITGVVSQLLDKDLSVRQVGKVIDRLGPVHVNKGERRVPTISQIQEDPVGHLVQQVAERWGYE